jgi:biotin synthase
MQREFGSSVVAELTQLEILEWLRESRPARLRELYRWGDAVRRQQVGDAVHLRGLIEISSHCARQCMYCGLRQGNRRLQRYRMTQAEIVECVRQAERLGYGTVVMQAGEDDSLTADWIAEIVQWIKRETALAVTLSLGERQEDELRLWREAGADRYLLRFETSDEKLFQMIHPQRFSNAPDRMALLKRLKVIGYEAGGGVMVGIPGQSFASLANDILAFRALDLDMIGIGPYIPHAATPLGSGALRPEIQPSEQVPNRAEMVYKAIALTRIVCSTANIPSTTALATIDKVEGRKLGLSAGANVVMPNLTPEKYRRLYQIYPDKACIEESAEHCHDCLGGQIHSLGRFVGRGPGGRGAVETVVKAPLNSPSQLVQVEI